MTSRPVAITGFGTHPITELSNVIKTGAVYQMNATLDRAIVYFVEESAAVRFVQLCEEGRVRDSQGHTLEADFIHGMPAEPIFDANVVFNQGATRVLAITLPQNSMPFPRGFLRGIDFQNLGDVTQSRYGIALRQKIGNDPQEIMKVEFTSILTSSKAKGKVAMDGKFAGCHAFFLPDPCGGLERDQDEVSFRYSGEQ